MFWWGMFLCNIAYSLIMIIAGWCMWKHCPKEINSMLGYRTKRSKLSQETWEYAHENCGKRWWKIGWIMLIQTVIVQVPFYGKSVELVGYLALVICVIECTILLVSIVPTEMGLKREFDEAGMRRK